MNHEKRIQRAECILFHDRDEEGLVTWEEFLNVYRATDPERFKRRALERHDQRMLKMLDEPLPPNIDRLIARFNRSQQKQNEKCKDSGHRDG